MWLYDRGATDPARSPKRATQKSIKVKPKMQWRPLKVGNARNMEPVLRKITGSSHTESKKEVTQAVTSKDKR